MCLQWNSIAMQVTLFQKLLHRIAEGIISNSWFYNVSWWDDLPSSIPMLSIDFQSSGDEEGCAVSSLSIGFAVISLNGYPFMLTRLSHRRAPERSHGTRSRRKRTHFHSSRPVSASLLLHLQREGSNRSEDKNCNPDGGDEINDCWYTLNRCLRR